MLLARQAPRAAPTAMLAWCWRRRGGLGGIGTGQALSSPPSPASPVVVVAAASSASASSSSSSSQATPPQQQPQIQQQQTRTFTTRDYPQEPRVGIGVVVFRWRCSPRPEILLIRRAKAPCKGEWCFAGGSLELGETVAQCAAREVAEETGIRLVGGAADAQGLTNLSDEARSDPDLGVGRDAEADARLDRPVPFAVVDSIVYDDGEGGGGGDGESHQQQEQQQQQQQQQQRKPQFHFAIVEVAAVAEDGDAPLVASDDADDARWFALDELRALKGLTRGCAALAEQAARRFRVRGE